jgi:serine protease Do
MRTSNPSARASVGAPFLALLVFCAADPGRAAPELTPAQRRRATPIVDVVRQEIDAVVNVSATHVVTQSGGGAFDYFDVPREVKQNSVGSGAVIHPSGYVLTNAHVVARASELSIIFADGHALPARLVASLPEDDIAIIKCDPPAPLRAIRLGRSDDLMVGESVIAIGNPLGLQHSVTTGIISALGREMPTSAEHTFKDIVQTDAAINPGNSGGPLLNILGEQIGVNTAIRSDAQNVGFAIPIDRVRALLPRLLAVEARARVKLGIVLGGEVTAPIAGATIASIEKGSPAARAGLSPGMTIMAVGEASTPSLIDALVALLEQPAGKPFRVLAVPQKGPVQDVRVTIEALPKPDGTKLALERFGLVLASLDAARAQRLGLRMGAGLLVLDVDRKGPGARAGVEPGDLVTRVGPYGVRDVDELGVLLEKLSAGDRVVVRVVRIDGRRVYQAEALLTAR